MAAITIAKNQVLFSSGEPQDKLFLIVKGSFKVTFPGGEYTLSKGEVPGICELYQDSHSMTCTALEDASVFTYPVADIVSLEALFRESPDYCMVFARSAFRQMNTLLQLHELLTLSCSNLYSGCTQDYAFYLSCCMRHQEKSRKLSNLDLLAPFTEDADTEAWAPSYYDGFQHLLSENGSSFLAKEPAVPTGLIAGLCKDFDKVAVSLSILSDYQKQALSLYMNDELEDILDLYTSLYLKLGPDSSDSASLYSGISRIISLLQASPSIDKLKLAQRVADFKECIKTLPDAVTQKEDKDVTPTFAIEQLKNSLQTILDYSDAADDQCAAFKKLIARYKEESDKNATDDASRNLRLEITGLFYEFYKLIFFKAIEDLSLPLPVRMFLYFGYVDEQLAGMDNSVYLGHFAEQMTHMSSKHVYTFFDWLKAIYEGKKEPSRNEFDEDYTDHLHALKASGKITEKEEAALLKDMTKKVEYELKNMFPVVNKMTFGRISTFCPVFSEHNVLKQLDVSLVTDTILEGALKSILATDYGAFYREYVFSNVTAGIPKEFFHVEVLPDMILMPNIGTRGVMWQEIEGRKRTTPARMMLSVFYLEDVQTAVVRLTGEYRWEMCKRVQGARWNDVSDRSLTSEYFDYVQFYRKNHELSPDMREKLKASLQKAHNSFKEMFVRDYITYLLFEATGSPRLTKPARTILFTYCPFSKAIRESLDSNPLYKEMLEHHNLKTGQLLHKIDLLEKRVENAKAVYPKELLAEKNFLCS